MIVDFRSDVLTKPSSGMMKAMMSASMGDDVYGEDEDVNALEDRVAKLTGKEAALFVVSGTMANQLGIAAQTSPRDEVLLDLRSHIFQFEQGAPAVISGVQLRPIPFARSLPSITDMEVALRFADIHHPTSRLLCLEITHNYNGGMIPNTDDLKKVCARAKELGLKIHIDGARIWNAVVASGVSIKEYASICDTMMFCFSKGLGTPIGSMLVGTKDTIERARYMRKGLGGGWRQPGMLAAAANYALDNNIDRLKEDHRRAQMLARAIEGNPELELLRSVETNIVIFGPKRRDVRSYSEKLASNDILQDWQHFGAIRLVTHLGIGDDMIEYAIGKL